jgi:hypothetical protein
MRLSGALHQKIRISYVDSRLLSPSEECCSRHPEADESGCPFHFTFCLQLHLYLRPLPVSSRRWSWSDGHATAKGKVPVASIIVREQCMVIGQPAMTPG